ncbi:signal peptidase I [Rubrivirga sp. S365]|uniref:Signal peptidase I n=1 Tax=Rubrivirga litoralis TaxID=3075598 RepID=A0ABU3BTF9_9BACT|nr:MULTISPECIES: signal peptidase I [unclassified Rubrivirga]MDT0632581.1 signal peptidase I [Rubrivirga sp. F394]MDT7856729.1 signal peptidase I [Rubrivirga sp. S365]
MATTTTRQNRKRTPRGADGRRREAPAKPTMKENLWFWAKAIVIILLLRTFIFEPFRIPSESMEETLLVGDFLIVSKLNYGPRTPSTIGIPFTGVYLPGVELPQTRLPGFSEPERGDVAVFNYPSAVDVERGAIPESTPVERRAPYIKRIVGTPGDTVAVLDKVLHIGGEPVPLGPTLKQRWRVTATGATRPNARQLAELGVTLLPGSDRRDGAAIAEPREYDVFATPVGVAALEALPEVARVDPFVLDESWRDPTFGKNPDHVPPFVVPGRGLTVVLDERTLPTYAEAIVRYEGRDLTQGEGGAVLIDGVPSATYTFDQDYYFVMGDFRDNSVDSRYWGFVPETHLVGKALFTFLSFERYLPPIPRLRRFFQPIP